jgi:hypothetical protein
MRKKSPSSPLQSGLVDDHRLAFGRGITTDDGHRREMCSSPRPHPELDAFLVAEFEAGRKSAFLGLQREVASMELLDTDAVEEEILARLPSVPVYSRLAARTVQPMQASNLIPRSGNLSPPPGTPPQQSPNTDGNQPELRHDVANEALTLSQQQQQQLAQTGRSVRMVSPPSHGHTGHGTSPNRVGGASPRPKRDVLSAAFSAPERFKETQKFVVAPSVGHYRPKYGAVEHAVVSGQIDPVALTKRRVPPLELAKDPVPQMTTVMTGARDEVRPLAVKEREARRAQRAAELAAGVDDDDNDLLTKRRSAGPPTATRTSSPAFRSKVAAVELAAHPTAAPDAMYYPAAENGTMHSARSHVEFAKQTPRPPMHLNAILPEPRSQLTAFSKEAARNAPDIAKYSPRSNGPRRRVPDAPLDVQRADGLRYERPRAADFTNSLSPRGEEDSRPSPRVGVSVEEVPALNHPSDRRAPASNFTTMLIRRDPKPPVDLPPLDLSLDAVSPRTRTVQMRSDAVGHRDFWNSGFEHGGGRVCRGPRIDPREAPAQF